MRYTTIIDLREWPQAYANQNIRLVYMHLCLCSGYHDYNRDVTRISLRQLAQDSGLTVSAVRHALKILEQLQLIRRKGGVTMVRKWIQEKKPSPRPKTQTQGVVTETPTETRTNGLQELKEKAVAGDLRAKELLQRLESRMKK